MIALAALPWGKIIAGILAAGIAFGAGWTVNGWRLTAEYEEKEVQHALQDAVRAAESTKLSEKYRKKEAQYEADKQESTRLAVLARVHANTDAAVVTAGNQRLLDAYRAAARPTTCATASAGTVTGSTAANGTVDVRAEVFAEAIAAAAGMAKEADQRFIAGTACEQQHGSVIQ